MSIYRRKSGRYAVVIRDLSGRRVSLGTFRMLQAAEAAQRKGIDARESGHARGDPTLTVRDLGKQYRAAQQLEWSPTTRVRADTLWRPLEAKLGEVKVVQLSPAQVSKFYGELRANGRERQTKKAGTTLAPRTVLHVHRQLVAAIRWAQREGMVSRNPLDAMKGPKAPSNEAKALDEAEVRTLLDASRDTVLRPLIMLAISTGMRRGELCALRWADVNLDGKMIAVRRAISETITKGKAAVLHEKGTKTGRTRLIPVSTLAARAIAEAKAFQNAQRMANRKTFEERDFVFADNSGGPIRPQLLTEAFRVLALRCGCSTLRFHSLRHSAATFMISSGADLRTVSSILGHSTPTVTLGVYGHIVAGAEASAVETIADRIDSETA